MLLLIAHVAACLPFKKGDELLTLIFQIDALVARRGEDIVASFGDALKKIAAKEGDASPNDHLKVFFFCMVAAMQHGRSVWGYWHDHLLAAEMGVRVGGYKKREREEIQNENMY